MSNGFPKLPDVRTTFAGKEKTRCGDCIHYCICSKLNVKNVNKKTDNCQHGEENHYARYTS